jgi:hypothetical protein
MPMVRTSNYDRFDFRIVEEVMIIVVGFNFWVVREIDSFLQVRFVNVANCHHLCGRN